MSTILYGTRTAARENSPTGCPSLSRHVDTLTALVPAEVLAFHTAFFGAFSEQRAISATDVGPPAGRGGATTEGTVTVITDPTGMRVLFGLCVAMSVVLFAASHVRRARASRRAGRLLRRNGFHPLDFARVLVPPAAFIGWTMLQQPSAFDAVVTMDEGLRFMLPAGVVITFGALAAGLVGEADRHSDPPAEDEPSPAREDPALVASLHAPARTPRPVGD